MGLLVIGCTTDRMRSAQQPRPSRAAGLFNRIYEFMFERSKFLDSESKGRICTNG